MQLRPYEPADAPALDEVCIRTGHHGGDASDVFEKPSLLCDLYLRPYLALEPGLAFVVAQGGVALGYVVGTADTREFAARCEREWWPALRARHALPLPAEADMSPDAQLQRRLHQGLGMETLPFLHDYPAHLHIDLLPQAQGHGCGRRLMEALFAALRQRGAPGVHLGVSALNEPAITFYRRMGFDTLEPQAWGEWMGMRL